MNDTNNGLPYRTLWKNEVYFNLDDSVNTMNCEHWPDTISYTVGLVPLFDAKVTV